MPAVTVKANREDLFREISGILRQWSELERNIFARAHYRGQSLKAISLSLKLDIEEIKAILKQCEHRLYASLREFRKISGENFAAETAALDARRQKLKSGHEIPCKPCKNPGTSQAAILSL